MKYITIGYGLDTGIRFAIDETLTAEEIRKQLCEMLKDVPDIIMEELFIPLKERQAEAIIKKLKRQKK
jgi:hypothetical protein